VCSSPLITCLFFFQAEDGIRDRNVTGVQTCALPIWFAIVVVRAVHHRATRDRLLLAHHEVIIAASGVFTTEVVKELVDERVHERSEERRVGKECRCGSEGGRWKEERRLVGVTGWAEG